MKDEPKNTQGKRLEELVIFLKTTTRDLANVVGVYENTLYKITCGHNKMSSRTASRICYNVEKELGVSINRQWLLTGEGTMLNEQAPPNHSNHQYTNATQDPSAMISGGELEPTDSEWKAKYNALLEKYNTLLEKYTDLLESQKA